MTMTKWVIDKIDRIFFKRRRQLCKMFAAYSMCVCSKKMFPFLSVCLNNAWSVILSLLPLFMGQKQYPVNDFWLSKSTKLKGYKDSRSTHYMRAILFLRPRNSKFPFRSLKDKIFSVHFASDQNREGFFSIQRNSRDMKKYIHIKLCPLIRLYPPARHFLHMCIV